MQKSNTYFDKHYTHYSLSVCHVTYVEVRGHPEVSLNVIFHLVWDKVFVVQSHSHTRLAGLWAPSLNYPALGAPELQTHTAMSGSMWGTNSGPHSWMAIPLREGII